MNSNGVLLSTYFGCHKFRSTTKRAGGRSVVHVLLTQTIIGNLNVSIHGQHDIVELKITIYDAILMKVFECQADLCCIESTIVSIECVARGMPNSLGSLGTKLSTLNMHHEISTTDVFHNKVHTGFCLETSM